MKCPSCNIEDPIFNSIYGVMPGLKCKARRDKLKSPDVLVEFTSNSIKKERKEYAKDIVQPFRGNEASKEFASAYPKKAKQMFTEKELKGIKNVWD